MGTIIIDALEMLYGGENAIPNFSEEQQYADLLASEFINQMNEWHSRAQPFDKKVPKQLMRDYLAVKDVFPSSPYFSPSAATACPRELYEKGIGSKRDKGGQQPHQKRWTNIGTKVGDMLQEDLLLIEKHWADAPFQIERTEAGYPAFEEFVAGNYPVSVDGVSFNLYGMSDGIMTYTDRETGEIVRVGLEIKSKQTTPAMTSTSSMREADPKHIAQCRLYSLMFNVDYYIIVYVNCAHKSWSMSPAEFEKSPDIRAFGFHFNDDDRYQTLKPLADVRKRIIERDPPLPDLTKFTFNNFKEAIARSITDEEMALLAEQVELAKSSSLKPFEIRNYVEAYEKLEKLRNDLS